MITKTKMEQKKYHIRELLNNVRELESRIVAADNNETLSFSFFRDAFRRIQDMMKLLHEMEMQQIEDMKVQMEKLVSILSESETGKEIQSVDENAQSISEQDMAPVDEKVLDSTASELQKDSSTSADLPIEEIIEDRPIPETRHNHLAKGIVLPGYVNPQAIESTETELPPLPDKISEEAVVPVISELENKPSLNDLHQVSTPQHEVKRNLSLNDRFFYQRELFDNNREAMNTVMTELNKLQTMEEVELYLRETTSWNFEDEHVKGFLDLLGKATN